MTAHGFADTDAVSAYLDSPTCIAKAEAFGAAFPYLPPAVQSKELAMVLASFRRDRVQVDAALKNGAPVRLGVLIRYLDAMIVQAEMKLARLGAN